MFSLFWFICCGHSNLVFEDVWQNSKGASSFGSPMTKIKNMPDKNYENRTMVQMAKLEHIFSALNSYRKKYVSGIFLVASWAEWRTEGWTNVYVFRDTLTALQPNPDKRQWESTTHNWIRQNQPDQGRLLHEFIKDNHEMLDSNFWFSYL